MNLAQLTRSIALLTSLTLITACGGGGGGSSGNAAAQGSNFNAGCTGFCATSSPANLTVTDVGNIISQAVQEAQARGVNATIAVTDRVGNVLAIFRMTGAASISTVQSTIVDSDVGLENITAIPSDRVAIAKAVTGSYLASEGNAFSTRTASQIVQEHFNPGENNRPGGPLFGVQFSQLPCSDLVTDAIGPAVNIGPQRSPLGLSADPGGFPIYKNGHPVGGIGVIADGIYGLDRDISDDNDANYFDESIAIAGQFGFAPPIDRQADRITVDGRSLRYSDIDSGDLLSNPQTAPAFAAINGVSGTLIDDFEIDLTDLANPVSSQNYFIAAGGILAGSTFGTGGSGVVDADSIDATFAGLDAFVLSDAAGAVNRYPPTLATVPVGNVLTAAEVTQILRSALGVANQARAQIRRPLDSQARVTISVVDTAGNILGIVRTRDAPLFGTDVSLQKARTATFFSSTDAGAALLGTPNADLSAAAPPALPYVSSIAQYVTDVRTFLGDATALNNGIAFADRSGGNLSRPYYPDGIMMSTNGPFSKPFTPANTATNQWSPFSTGLQLDLIYNQLVSHLTGVNATDCTELVMTDRLANGIQIFPGSVPIYRNGVLVGGIGVSGDGIEQDDMISFLGTNRASLALGGDGIGNLGDPNIGNAVISNRADQIIPVAPNNVALRYVQCPQNPFLNNNDQNVCDGL